MKTALIRAAAVSAVAALAVSTSVASADVVITAVNQRIAPGLVPASDTFVSLPPFELDLNGDGTADATLEGLSSVTDTSTIPIPGITPKIRTSSFISLSDVNDALVLSIVAGEFNPPVAQPAVTAGTVIGAPTDYIYAAGVGFNLLGQERTLTSDGDTPAESFDTFGPFADFFNPVVVDTDDDGVLDGPLFIGFSLQGSDPVTGGPAGPANFGFLQFDQIDSAADIEQGLAGEFESALTLVGFAYETTQDTPITTFDITAVPEPTLGLVAGVGGLLALRRRR